MFTCVKDAMHGFVLIGLMYLLNMCVCMNNMHYGFFQEHLQLQLDINLFAWELTILKRLFMIPDNLMTVRGATFNIRDYYYYLLLFLIFNDLLANLIPFYIVF